MWCPWKPALVRILLITFDCLIKASVLRQIFYFYELELALPVASIEEFKEPGRLLEVADGASDPVASFQKLVDDVRGDVAVGSRDEDEGAGREGGGRHCYGRCLEIETFG